MGERGRQKKRGNQNVIMFPSVPLSPGFAAMDITVTVMTEVIWAFVLQEHTLLDIAFKYTIRFLLAPVSETVCVCVHA